MADKNAALRMEVFRYGLRAGFARATLAFAHRPAMGFRYTEKAVTDIQKIYLMFFPDEPAPDAPNILDALIEAEYAWQDSLNGVRSDISITDEQVFELWHILAVDSQHWFEHWATTLQYLAQCVEDMK